MKLYQFVGGKYHGKTLTREEVDKISNGQFSYDFSNIRAAGGTVPRAELDNQPLVTGYLNPSHDGIRYRVNGELKRDWKCTEEEKQGEPIHILRYETQEVNDTLSH